MLLIIKLDEFSFKITNRDTDIVNRYFNAWMNSKEDKLFNKDVPNGVATGTPASMGMHV